MINQKEFQRIVERLIQNNFNKYKTANELGVDISVFTSESFLEFVKQYCYLPTKEELAQIVLFSMGTLEDTSRTFHKDKQKYIDQLMILLTGNSNKEDYEVEEV